MFGISLFTERKSLVFSNISRSAQANTNNSDLA